MSTLTITHTSADGTLLEGSSKGDGALDALRAGGFRTKGWRWFPSIKMIGIAHSRDRSPQLYVIDGAAEVLREAGFEVTVEIDGTPRAMEVAETDRAERMDDRAAALAGKAERLTSESDSRYAAAHEIAHGIPMGQPVLVGHHSERGHRAALKRMDGHMRKSVEAAAEAEDAAYRAATAERHMEARNNPRRVYRRIKELRAELGRIDRALEGYRTRHLDGQGNPVYVFDHAPAEGRHRQQRELDKAHAEEQIRYWTEALDAARAAGADVPPDIDSIKKGYWVRSWAGWNEVASVNKVTVSVWRTWGNPNAAGREKPFRQPIKLDNIHEIRERSPYEPDPAQDLDTELAALDAADAEQAEEPAQPAVTAPASPAPTVPAGRRGGLSDAAWEALSQAAATERSVHLATTVLPRPVYVEVDRFLTRIGGGGRWDRRERAHLYNRDPRPDLEALVGARVLPPASATDDKRLAYFATPEMTARMMSTELGQIGTGRILEPSAGDGQLVLAALWFHPDAQVTAVEVDDARVRLLCRRFNAPGQVQVYSARFQDFAAGQERDGADPFDAVIMNPPFTEPGDRMAWANHFRTAWELLRPGGRMVAILPASYRFSEMYVARHVRDLVEGSDGMVVDLPEGTFAKVGTRVNTVLVCVTKRAG